MRVTGSLTIWRQFQRIRLQALLYNKANNLLILCKFDSSLQGISWKCFDRTLLKNKNFRIRLAPSTKELKGTISSSTLNSNNSYSLWVCDPTPRKFILLYYLFVLILFIIIVNENENTHEFKVFLQDLLIDSWLKGGRGINYCNRSFLWWF
jgi:hypothetical protein